MASEKASKGTLSGEGKPKHHEAHIRKLHNGYHVEKHHADGSKTEHAADDLESGMQQVSDHMEQGDAQELPEGADASAQSAAPPAPAQGMAG